MPADFAAARRSRADRARQIADVLRRQVASGMFSGNTASGNTASGDTASKDAVGRRLLPSEADLAREFAASRNAVRDALAILGAEGVVTRVQGIGTVVAGAKVRHGLRRLTGLAETLTEHGEILNEVRAAGVVTPPPAVAARLRPPDGPPSGGPPSNDAPPGGEPAGGGRPGEPPETVVYIERLRRLNGLPLSLDLTYLVPDIGEPLLSEDLAHHDIFALIEARTGQSLGDADITIEALSADPHTAAVLAVPPGAPLLMMERLTRLAGGRPVDLEYIRLRGDRLALHGEISRGGR